MTDAELVAWTTEPAVLAILLIWGLGEAVVLPIVPDVLLGLMALATPAALGLPLAAAIVGAIVGAVVLAELRRRRPGLVAGSSRCSRASGRTAWRRHAPGSSAMGPFAASPRSDPGCRSRPMSSHSSTWWATRGCPGSAASPW